MNTATDTHIEARDVLSVDDVAKLLRCATTTVEERARSGELPGLKYGDGGWVFPVGALRARLDQLAIEQSAERRQPRKPPSAVLLPVPTKAKRQPPALPKV